MSKVLRELCAATGLHGQDVRRIILAAPNRYKVYTIAKRSGGRRTIAQPTPEVKFLQRAFVEAFLSPLPVHPCATAYKKGVSIRENAVPHAASGPILKMDFRDFFPSIKSRDWRSYCKDHEIFEDMEDISLSERLLFYRSPGAHILSLSIGAPSSPILSNILMLEFDKMIVDAVSGDNVIYTRYADDMTFSAPRTGYLVKVKSKVSHIVRSIKYPKLDINHKKTTYVTKKYHRSITGLTISNEGEITLGRDRKRRISASVNRVLHGDMSNDGMAELAGFLAYVKSVEPDFLTVLERKYGVEIVEFVMKFGPGLHRRDKRYRT